MKRMSRILSVVGLVALALALLPGCCSVQSEDTGMQPPPEPAPKKAMAVGCPAVSKADGNVTVSMAIPTGEEATSVVLLEKTAPEIVNVGQETEYQIKVTNLTDCNLDDVIVRDAIPTGFNLKSSAPQAKLGTDSIAVWNLGTIEGNGSELIRVRGIPTKVGKYTHCAQVSYKTNLCITIEAVEPALKLNKTMPGEALFCEDIPIRLVVTNPGSGVARNVTITDTLPEGLKTTDGKQVVSINAGDLAAGASKEFNLVVKAQKTGSFKNSAVAKAAGGLEASADASVVVRQPVLTIEKTGPAKQYAGRGLAYDIVVANKGDAPATNLTVSDAVPNGTTFVSASDGGTVSGGVVTWRLGTLAPGASKKVSLKLTAATIGKIVNKATAAANCATPVADSVPTELDGVPAVLLEVIDLVDPVNVGDESTYVITATNQGSIPGINVAITASLEENEVYVSSDGPTKASVTGNVIKFAPLPRLAVGDKASWKVVIKAVKAGDVRFKVEMNMDQLSRPVNETEATQIY